MKIQIDVDVDKLQLEATAMATASVRQYVSGKISNWETEQMIKKIIGQALNTDTLRAIIAEELADSPALRIIIRDQIKAKLKLQLNKLLKDESDI